MLSSVWTPNERLVMLLITDVVSFRTKFGQILDCSLILIIYELLGEKVCSNINGQHISSIAFNISKHIGSKTTHMDEVTELVIAALRRYGYSVVDRDNSQNTGGIKRLSFSELDATLIRSELELIKYLRAGIDAVKLSEGDLLVISGFRPIIKDLCGCKRWSNKRCIGLHTHLVQVMRNHVAKMSILNFTITLN